MKHFVRAGTVVDGGAAIQGRRRRRRKLGRGPALMAAAALTSLGWSVAAGGAAGAASQSSAGVFVARPTYSHLAFRGTVNVRDLARTLTPAVARRESADDGRAPVPLRRGGAVSSPAVPAPDPAGTAVSATKGGASGFVGITDSTQRLADNGNGYNTEPPDQGLCASGGLIVETVNHGVQVYTETKAALTPVISLNRFFHLAPGVDRSFSPPTYGPYLADPRCYYDPEDGRWIVTALEIDANPLTGALAYRSAEFIAVSQTADPVGTYGIFSFDTTNDGTAGTPRERNCPCFGDYPRIGADRNGFYLSTDSYPIHGLLNSNGGELYAMAKSGLAAAATGASPPPTVVAFHTGATTINNHPANAAQPAQTPEGGAYAPDTEYLMSTPDFNGFATHGGAGAKALVVWALRGTRSLNSTQPKLTLGYAKVPSQRYAPPAPVAQRRGPIPLGRLVNEPEPMLSPFDDRLQQVEYVEGRLYSSLNSGVGPAGSANRTGAAWFVVTPNVTSTGRVGGAVIHQGYVAIGGGASVLYPAIGLTASGRGAMVFSITGPQYYPSAAFIRFDPTGPAGPVHVNRIGSAPEDGFSCYAAYGGNGQCRWGDYSAASSDGAGNIVMATEMIPDTPRNTVANWGTYISRLNP